jgi:maleate cis-trans isomerase
MTTVGLLYPGHGAEDDFPALLDRLKQAQPDGWNISLPLVQTSVDEDAHRVDALIDLGKHERLAEGAQALAASHHLDSLMWACTSGSFVLGWAGAHEQVDKLAEVSGLPTSSTSLAFVSACQALGVTKVSVAASYPRDVAECFVSFLQRADIEVVALDSYDIYTAAEVGALTCDQVIGLVAGAKRDDAEAVLVPDTAMHSLAWVDELEGAAGMPVLTANQVTIFEGLRLGGGGVPPLPGLGALFRSVAVLAGD